MVYQSVLTLDNICLFIESKENNGLKTETIKSYKRNLMYLLKVFSNKKDLTLDMLNAWVTSMFNDEVPIRTINHRISSCNSFFAFMNRYDLQITPPLLSQNHNIEKEKLTRSEYLHLLTVAKKLKHECTFYLLRTIASTGISIQDLKKLTVRFIYSDDEYIISFKGEKVRIPHAVKKELITYAVRNKIVSGPIFVTQNGNSLERSLVNRRLAELCNYTKIPKYKVTLSSLRRLYYESYNYTKEQFYNLINQAYDCVLENEQQDICWG